MFKGVISIFQCASTHCKADACERARILQVIGHVIILLCFWRWILEQISLELHPLIAETFHLDEWKMWPVGGAGWKSTDHQESCSEHICTKLKGNPFSGWRYLCLSHRLTNKHRPSLKPGCTHSFKSTNDQLYSWVPEECNSCQSNICSLSLFTTLA